MNKWQPIDTAPEDEKIIIFATPDWIDTAWYVRDEDADERVWFWGGAARIHHNHTPTHWMPLPEPPK